MPNKGKTNKRLSEGDAAPSQKASKRLQQRTTGPPADRTARRPSRQVAETNVVDLLPDSAFLTTRDPFSCPSGTCRRLSRPNDHGPTPTLGPRLRVPRNCSLGRRRSVQGRPLAIRAESEEDSTDKRAQVAAM